MLRTNKAFVLTRCPVSFEDRASIEQSSIFKIAVNMAKYKADVRLFHDHVYWKSYLEKTTEPLISSFLVNNHERFIFKYKIGNSPNSQDKEELYFKEGSIIPAIDYCIKIVGANEILLIADNTAHNKEFQERINEAIKQFKVNIYQFTAGNFNLPVKSIKDFIQCQT